MSRTTSRGSRALAAAGLSQIEVASASGVSQKSVSAVLAGERAGAPSRARVLGAVAGLAGIAEAAVVEASILRAEREREAT